MGPRISFTLDGAEMARDLIDESFQYAVNRWEESIKENDPKQKQNWLERVLHLMNELNWIDKLIINLKFSPDRQSDQDLIRDIL
jgi:hypothetical protein